MVTNDQCLLYERYVTHVEVLLEAIINVNVCLTQLVLFEKSLDNEQFEIVRTKGLAIPSGYCAPDVAQFLFLIIAQGSKNNFEFAL